VYDGGHASSVAFPGLALVGGHVEEPDAETERVLDERQSRHAEELGGFPAASCAAPDIVPRRVMAAPVRPGRTPVCLLRIHH
jgi:hypothetical protein